MRRTWLVIIVVALLASGCARATGDRPAPAAPAGAGWERLPDPPLSGRTTPAVAVVDGRLHVFGGWTALCPPNADCTLPDGPAFRDGAVLDLDTSRWQPMSDAPYGLRGVSTAVLGSDVYVASSCHVDVYCQGPYSFLRYDTVADRWEERAPLPRSSRYVSLVAAGDRVYAVSTTDENGERPDAVYDAASDTWEELPDDPLPESYDRSAVVPDGRLLLFASIGVDDGERRKAVAALDLSTRDWTLLPDAPGPGYQAWRSGDEIWLNPHYGDDGGGVLDLATDSWSSLPVAPEPTEFDMAGIVGGGSATFEYDAGWMRDTDRDRWFRVPERPDPAYDGTVTAVGESLVVVGGQRWDGQDDREGELLAETWIWRP